MAADELGPIVTFACDHPNWFFALTVVFACAVTAAVVGIIDLVVS